jgi:pimeloyl-ACP methyl ester carboxylesterase
MLEHLEAGRGEAVLLLHGFALDARMWRPQLDGLSSALRVIAPTLPDFGPLPQRTQGTAARAVVELMDALGIASAHVVGHSLGGAVAVDLALAFPGRARSLVLVDALLRGRPTQLAESKAAAAHAAAGRLEEARAAWLGGGLFAASMEDAATRAQLLAMAADYDGAHWLGRAETRFELPAHEPRLRDLLLPALVIAGERDTPAFRAMSEAYASAVPGAQAAWLAGAGHMPNLERPEAFNGALLGFLRT